jgi:hypothetical protein
MAAARVEALTAVAEVEALTAVADPTAAGAAIMIELVGCRGTRYLVGHPRITASGTESLQTLRWRELDSNFRFRATPSALSQSPLRLLACSAAISAGTQLSSSPRSLGNDTTKPID